jgi:hypothetical protein
MRRKMERIEDVINECLTLFEGQVIEVRYTEERKKRLEQYLKWSKEKKAATRKNWAGISVKPNEFNLLHYTYEQTKYLIGKK